MAHNIVDWLQFMLKPQHAIYDICERGREKKAEGGMNQNVPTVYTADCRGDGLLGIVASLLDGNKPYFRKLVFRKRATSLVAKREKKSPFQLFLLPSVIAIMFRKVQRILRENTVLREVRKYRYPSSTSVYMSVNNFLVLLHTLKGAALGVSWRWPPINSPACDVACLHNWWSV